MRTFTDFYEAWRFLEEHPIFEFRGLSNFLVCLEIEVVKVNPVTEKIDKDDTKNTAVRVWLECGPWEGPDELTNEEREYHPVGVPSYDINLDCGTPTFEEAIIKLANLVLKKYGS